MYVYSRYAVHDSPPSLMRILPAVGGVRAGVTRHSTVIIHPDMASVVVVANLTGNRRADQVLQSRLPIMSHGIHINHGRQNAENKLNSMTRIDEQATDFMRPVVCQNYNFLLSLTLCMRRTCTKGSARHYVSGGKGHPVALSLNQCSLLFV